MRVEQGSFKTKEDRNSGCYFLHRLTQGVGSSIHVASASGGPKRADAGTLNEIYKAFLASLNLSKSHREDLRRRGFTDEMIDQNVYKTLPIHGRAAIARVLHERFDDKVLSVPGFVVKEGQSGRYVTVRGPKGLVVPVRDPVRRIIALKVRRDDSTNDGSKYVYLTSAGFGGPSPGAPAHVPLGTTTPAELVRVTEGELKADAAVAISGLATVSIPGVTTWNLCFPILKQIGAKVVRLAFDMDAWDKPTVAKALSRCADAIVQEGYELELERWAPTDGKGIDDLLAADKTPEVLGGEEALTVVREMLASATSGDVPVASDELARLYSILQSGGAEALFREEAILKELVRLESEDSAQFAAIRASIKGQVSLRELDKALVPLRRDLARARPPEVAPACPYRMVGGRIVREQLTKNGAVEIPLCNFSAQIVEVINRDDGAERTTAFGIEGKRADGSALPRAEVLADQFPRLDWVTPAWRGMAIVYAGQGTRDHLRAALELLSPERQYRTEFLHIGWTKNGSEWYFLHAAGAIGANGPVKDVQVALPEALSGFELPVPPSGKELTAAVQASLKIVLNLAPDRIAFPLLAAVYRSVLGDCDFSVHLSGPTGNFKTELAALAQQHFGAALDSRHLPASWSSTGNALEGIAFAAKDALLVVDDFAPSGSTHDVQRYHREADRLLRAQGNHAGRLRMRADSSIRPSKPPRGLILSTGEDTPRGQSLRARLFVVEVSPGDVDLSHLTDCQKDAADGLYAEALTGFICWLALRYSEVRDRLRKRQAELRDAAAADGQHARTPGLVANLALGLRHFLDFALNVHAVSEQEASDLWSRGWRALMETAAEQASHIAASEPAGQYLRLLSAALASGRAHIADPDGKEPTNPKAWGWRARDYTTHLADGFEDNGTDWIAQGRRIGWLDKSHLYLEPDAAYAEAQELARHQGECIHIAPRTLNKRLFERGLLADIEKHGSKTRYTVRRMLEGQRRDVICVLPDSLSAPRSAPSAPDAVSDGQPLGASAHAHCDGVQHGACECANGALALPSARRENVNEHESNGSVAHLNTGGWDPLASENPNGHGDAWEGDP
jgi:hypothetical protein